MKRLAGYIFSPLIFLFIVLSFPMVAHAESISLQPTKDTYVSSAAPTSGYGSIGLGTVSYQPPTARQMVLMHFDLNSIPPGSNISSATLTMRFGGCINNSASAGSISSALYLTNGSPVWTEASTYQQLSTNGSSLDGFSTKTIGCTPGGYIVFEMTEAMQYLVDRSIPNDGLVLLPIGGGDYWTRVFYMREAADSSRPALKINYTIPSETVTSPDGGPIESTGSTGSGSSAGTPTNSIKADKADVPLAPDLTIIPPVSITASQPKDNSNIVNLEWKKSETTDVQKYRIFRKSSGQEVYTRIAEISADKTTYQDKDIKADKQYSYFVRAVRNDKESENSPVATIQISSKKTSTLQTEPTNTTPNYMWLVLGIAVLMLIAIIIAYLRLHKKHRHLKNKEATKKSPHSELHESK